MRRLRSRTRRLSVVLGLTIPVAMTACTQVPRTSQTADPVSRLRVTIHPLETTLTAGGEVAVGVTIRNEGDQQEIWGSGSSHCRLSLLVLVEGEMLPVGPSRMCTMDIVQHRLEPGREYTEMFRWDGTVLRAGRPEALPRGGYELYGRGGETLSAAAMIHLQN